MSVLSLLGSPASANIPTFECIKVFKLLLTKLKLGYSDSHTLILSSHLNFVPCSESLKVDFFFHHVVKLNRPDHTAVSLFTPFLFFSSLLFT